MVILFNKIKRAWLDYTVHIVHIGGTEYGVRRTVFPGRYTYLDLTNTSIAATVVHTVAHNFHGVSTTPSNKILWWSTVQNIRKYCSTVNLEKVIQARENLLNIYSKQVPELSLPPVCLVKNIKLELAQYKLAGNSDYEETEHDGEL